MADSKKAWRWRDHIKIHPAAELFPLMAPDELQKLADDIKQNGIKVHPVFLMDEHDMLWLLDGRNRLDAAELAGDFPSSGFDGFLGGGSLREFLEWDRMVASDDPWDLPSTIEVFSAPADPYELVVSLNILRRHLTTTQKQALIDKLLTENPDRSDRQTAGLAKVSPTTVGTRRQRLAATGAIPKVTETVGRDGRIRTATPARPKTGTAVEHEPTGIRTLRRGGPTSEAVGPMPGPTISQEPSAAPTQLQLDGDDDALFVQALEQYGPGRFADFLLDVINCLMEGADANVAGDFLWQLRERIDHWVNHFDINLDEFEPEPEPEAYGLEPEETADPKLVDEAYRRYRGLHDASQALCRIYMNQPSFDFQGEAAIAEWLKALWAADPDVQAAIRSRIGA